MAWIYLAESGGSHSNQGWVVNELNQVTHLYISQGDIKRIYNGCDLGDSVKVNVYQYPHKDQLAYLDCFVLERKDLFQDAVKLLKSRDKEINELRLIISGKTFDAEYAKAQSEAMGLMQEKIEKASARIEELEKKLKTSEFFKNGLSDLNFKLRQELTAAKEFLAKVKK